MGPLAYGAAITLGVGLLMSLSAGRPESDLSAREAFLLVFLVWLSLSVLGSLPFYFSPSFATFTDAFFEAASGFSTTGATVLPDVEVLPDSIQLWRHLTHWVGGMGVVLLGIAILPLVGLGGMQLYRAEFSGARSEKLKPRVRETAMALWRIYVALTVAQIITLRVAGMSWFDAVCHSFSTLATGGFSTRTASVAAFNSPLIEYIIIVFMLLAGISFVQHYRLWVEQRPGMVTSDFETRWYLFIVFVGTAIVAVTLLTTASDISSPVRVALFQVSSIVTTTGFVTANWEQWAPVTHIVFLVLMFVGGCTGSTAGGLKIARMVLLSRVVDREFRKMVAPRGVFAVRLGGRVIEEQAIGALLNLIYLAFVVNFFACLLLSAAGVDVLTTITAVASCMFNVGPALGSVGPAEHYGQLPDVAKWVLSFCMLAGRLEFYSILVIFTPIFWRK